jgi:quercetin dioxygenase-like cupin family protein
MSPRDEHELDPFLAEAADGDPATLEALASLAHALPPASLPPALRQRILESAARANRFEHMANKVAALADLAVERARKLLAYIDDPSKWLHAPPPAHTLWFEGGPALAGAITGFVKVQPGTAFPRHTHLGEETVLVLQGTYVDGRDGRVVPAGSVEVAPPGSDHGFEVPPDGPPLVFLAIIHEGVDIGGQIVRPGDMPHVAE